ncbi:MAG: sugar ABC transporter permease [Desulfurococcales archaeon ex4484_204]|nr:MAG: sugar ABC transporter permease [Desulfurococcales archaeon ex4484_204]
MGSGEEGAVERAIVRRYRILYMSYPVIAVALSIAILALVMYLIGVDPIKGLRTLFYSSFGNAYYVTETLVRATPILMVSLGLMFAFSAGVWNIGAEGQLYIGGVAAAVTAISLGWLPPPIPLIVAWVAGGVAGALWAFPPAALKAKYGINEVFTTLMLNYVAIYFVSYLLHGPLMNPTTLFPETVTLPESSWLPRVVPGYRLHAGTIALFAVFVPLTYLVIKRTPVGFNLRLVGSNPELARSCGINIGRQVMLTLMLSGFFAGLSGANEVTGVVLKMRPDISPGYGYMGIAVALLGRLNPVGIALASIFMAGVVNGSYTISMMLKIPIGIAQFTQGLLIVIITLGELLIRRLTEARKAPVELKPGGGG